MSSGSGVVVVVLVAAVLFSVHPIHMEPVDSIMGQCDFQCAFFFLAGVLYYLDATA